MAIYSTLRNKAAASRLNFKESLSNLNLNNSKGKSFSTYNTTPKPNAIMVYIFSVLNIYTKV